jgi:hypothetical protein
MLASMMTYYRAWENRRFVRRLLREKQPEFAVALESAVREPPCPLCHGSQCSMPGKLTPPQPPQPSQLAQPSQPRRHMAPAAPTGPAGHAARPARGRRPQPSRIQ